MQRIILKTDKSKVEVVSILKLNTESWHRDGSAIPLEGIINDEGNFSFKKARNDAFYKEEDAGLTFVGFVSEEDNKAIIFIKLEIKPMLFVLYALMLCVGIVSYICIYNATPAEGAKRYPAFIPLIFFGFFPILKYYYTYTKVKGRTLELIKLLVS